MRSCLAETTLKLLTVLGVVVTINKVVFPMIITILPCDYNYFTSHIAGAIEIKLIIPYLK
jgi:hypothetical protein